MAYYVTCPNCGANLDPNESCDCKENAPKMFWSNKPDKIPVTFIRFPNQTSSSKKEEESNA